MTKDGFLMYMHQQDGSILNPAHSKVHQDMQQPLNHYYISSSHNTYLTADQLKGPSSTEAYIRWVEASEDLRGLHPIWDRVLGNRGRVIPDKGAGEPCQSISSSIIQSVWRAKEADTHYRNLWVIV